MNAMTYRGYEALVRYDEDAEIYHGEVMNLRDAITFQGSAAGELKQAFAGFGRGLPGLLPGTRRGTREACQR